MAGGGVQGFLDVARGIQGWCTLHVWNSPGHAVALGWITALRQGLGLMWGRLGCLS